MNQQTTIYDFFSDKTEEEYITDTTTDRNIHYGDIYQLDKHLLMCGDATKKEDIEKLTKGWNIDILLTDAPYGIKAVKQNKIGGDKAFGKSGGADHKVRLLRPITILKS